MSKLAQHLHGYPPGTLVTPAMAKTDRELKALIDAEAEEEKAEARRLVASGEAATWGDAIKQVVARKQGLDGTGADITPAPARQKRSHGPSGPSM